MALVANKDGTVERVDHATRLSMERKTPEPTYCHDSVLLKIAQVCQRTIEISGSSPIKFVISQDLIRDLAEEVKDLIELERDDGFTFQLVDDEIVTVPEKVYRICGVQIEVDRAGPGKRFKTCIQDHSPKWRKMSVKDRQEKFRERHAESFKNWRDTCEPKHIHDPETGQ